MNVAIIPARGGSKRIEGKNIKPFVGKPIIAYSILTAIKSGLFDKVVVSTDSEEISRVAQEFGALVPFMRPEELADDMSPTAPVLEHALNWMTKNWELPEYACCIYPTAPFLSVKILIEGLSTLKKYHCTTSFGVTSFAFPIFRSIKIENDGVVSMFWPEFELTRSQDLQEAYHDAGQFYWLNAKKFLSEPRLYASDSRVVILPRKLVQDIDTPEDWEVAEYMFKAQFLKG